MRVKNEAPYGHTIHAREKQCENHGELMLNFSYINVLSRNIPNLINIVRRIPDLIDIVLHFNGCL